MGAFSWAEYLNDPHLVARIQEFFGVRTGLSQTYTSSHKGSKTWTPTTEQNHLYHNNRKRRISDDDDKCSNSSSGSSGCDTGTGGSIISNFGSSENDCTTSGIGTGNSSDEGNYSKELDFDRVIRNKFWYYVAIFGSALGDEVFYACFFPFWFWNIDGSVCRRVVLIWGLLMYIGQGLKDIIKIPRPVCPPVVRLEKKWSMEFSMPSTHAIVSSAVPFSVLYFTSTRYQYPFIYGLIGCIIWCSLVCISRIYLGMHTVLDVLVGVSIVAISLPTWAIPLVDWLDPILLKDQYGSLLLLAGGLTLAFLSPGGDRWTPARGDTIVILGTCVGLNSGAWMNYQLGIIRGPPLDPPVDGWPIIWPTYAMLGMSLLRLAIGLVVIYATKAIAKTLAILIIRPARPIKGNSATFSSVVNCTRSEIFAELSTKFITYLATCFNVVFLSPVVFRLLEIERPTFHTEI